jgi:hypothetical protein
MKNIVLTILTLLLFASCESIIDPDLRDIPPQLVIEGEITNSALPDTVRLSMSTGFNEPSRFLGVENALVIISDGVSEPDTLAMTGAGIYHTTKLTGTPGRTYSLRVLVDGKEYIAECLMPQAATFDSLKQESLNVMGMDFTTVKAYYTDFADTENFYRFRLFINGEQQRSISLTSDRNADGKPMEISFVSYDLFAAGNILKLQLLTIAPEVYDYFSTLQSTLSSQNVAPANPKTNIRGGCLGYFSAHTVQEREVVIE